MIDPISAFGIAANIVQFIEVGYNVTLLFQQLLEASATDENIEIATIAEDMNDYVRQVRLVKHSRAALQGRKIITGLVEERREIGAGTRWDPQRFGRQITGLCAADRGHAESPQSSLEEEKGRCGDGGRGRRWPREAIYTGVFLFMARLVSVCARVGLGWYGFVWVCMERYGMVSGGGLRWVGASVGYDLLFDLFTSLFPGEGAFV